MFTGGRGRSVGEGPTNKTSTFSLSLWIAVTEHVRRRRNSFCPGSSQVARFPWLRP